MYACEGLFGEEMGRQVRALAEASIGGPCPCLRGDPCPITPNATEPVLLALPFLARD